MANTQNIVWKFDTTAFTTTAYTVTSATDLRNLCTDGTYVYASDYGGGGPPTSGVMIWRLTTSGTVTSFFSAAESAGSLYFDGTDIWMTSRNGGSSAFRQINTSGTALNTYTFAAINHAGGLLNDGTYWWSGEGQNGGGNGLSYAPTSSPSSWTNIVTTNTPTLVSALAGGATWYGDGSGNINSVAGGVFTPAAHLVFSGGAAYSGQLTFDGTSLWATNANPLNGGMWQTTPAAPTVGTAYPTGTGVGTIIYDATTQMLWATGLDSGGHGFVYSASLTTMKIIGVI